MIIFFLKPSFLQRLLTGIILLGIAVILSQLQAFWSSIFLAFILGLILLTEWPRLAKGSLWLHILTPVYPVAPFVALIALNQSESCRLLVLLAFIVAAVHDTGSYIVGSLIGRHYIAPTISPGKTYEGFFGGLMITGCLLYQFFNYLHVKMPYYFFIGLTVLLCVSAFLGDLFESWLKRRVHIKDSGTILPGHGGLLDRLDSVMFVGLVIYVFRHVLSMLMCT